MMVINSLDYLTMLLCPTENTVSTMADQQETANAQTLEALSHTVAHMQSSFANAYAQLAANLESTKHVIGQFNSVMEELLKSGVHIEVTHLSNTQFRVRISNRGRMPIPQFSVSSAIVAVTGQSIPSEEEASLHISDASAPMNCDLFEAGHSLSYRIAINLREPNQCNVKITVSFPSPGTGAPLAVSSTFGVYMLYQCRVSSRLPSNDQLQGRNVESASIDLVRRLLHIRSTDAFPSVGSEFELVCGVHVLILILDAVGDDDGHGCQLSFPASSCSPVLVKELVALCRASR
jgi:hypothetical protein